MLATALALTLAACSSTGAAPVQTTSSAESNPVNVPEPIHKAEPSETAAKFYTVPDVTGQTLKTAIQELHDYGIPKISLGNAEQVYAQTGVKDFQFETDLASYSGEHNRLNQLVVEETVPAAGTKLETIDGINIITKPTLPAEAKGSIWSAICSQDDSEDDESETFTFYHLKDIWKSKMTSCEFELLPEKTFNPTKKELEAIRVVSKPAKANEDADSDYIASNDSNNGFGWYGELLDSCAYYEPPVEGESDYRIPTIKAAAMICPESPFYKELDGWGNGKFFKFTDGKHVVGEEIPPGTYNTVSSATECYWERATPNGRIIANDFINYASKGAVVTIRKGESFISERCGTWEKK